MHAPVRFLLGALTLLGPAGLGACQSFPPVVTAVTVFPSDALGAPLGDDMRWTRIQPPIPLIGMRPGPDPREGAMFLNEPTTGRVAITLARGVQNFLLFTAMVDPSDYFVVAIYLDHDSAPTLSGVVTGDLSRPVEASRAPLAMSADGDAIANHSALEVVRDGYRVALRRAAFPLPGLSLDALNPWRLQPDDIVDSVGVITIEVQPAGADHRFTPRAN